APTNKAAYVNRAYAHHKKGELDKALTDLDEAIRLDPRYAYAYGLRGNVHFEKGDLAKADKEWEKSIAEYRSILTSAPHDSLLTRGLACLLATCPAERFRDGPAALKLARRACELTEWRERNCLDALAAACAEVGQFDQAIEYQAKALALETDGYYDREAGKRQLEVYRKRQGYRDPPSPSPTPASRPAP